MPTSVKPSIICLLANARTPQVESWAFAVDAKGLEVLANAGVFYLRTCKLCDDGIVVRAIAGDIAHRDITSKGVLLHSLAYGAFQLRFSRLRGCALLQHTLHLSMAQFVYRCQSAEMPHRA